MRAGAMGHRVWIPLLAIVLAGGLIGSVPMGVRASEEDIASKFTGHWRLVSFENFGEDGSVSRREIIGRIMYDGMGNMSAQLMPQGEAFKQDEANPRRTSRYTAYFGRYAIDTEAGTVTHRPEGATVFDWVGGELIRYYTFEDGKLKLSLKNDEARVTGTLTWERLK